MRNDWGACYYEYRITFRRTSILLHRNGWNGDGNLPDR